MWWPYSWAITYARENELLEEVEVDVDLGVRRAVEGADVRARAAAAGAHPAAEEVEPRFLERLPGSGEGVGPVAVEGVVDGDDLAVELLVRRRAGLARLGDLRVVRALPLLDAAEPTAAARERDPAPASSAPATEHLEEEEDDQADDAEAPAADGDPAAQTAAPTAGAPQVVDRRRVEVGVLVEPHQCLPRPSRDCAPESHHTGTRGAVTTVVGRHRRLLRPG
jgi:hypothetical protein